MNMKKMLAVVAAASLVAIAAPAFANPFSDVPLNHWAYDAVDSLTAKGVIEGYPDGTFRGNKTMTRYEIATVVARALANENVGNEDIEQLKALVVEFGPELEAMGVKVDGFDARLASLEKGLSGWKISGMMKFDYYSNDEDMGMKDGFNFKHARLFLNRDVTDKISFSSRWHADRFDRYWLTVKDFGGIEGLQAKFGQMPIDWEGDDGLYSGSSECDAFMMDLNYRGVYLTYNNGPIELAAFAASNDGGNVYDANASGDYYGLRAKVNFGEKAWISLNAYYAANDSGYTSYTNDDKTTTETFENQKSYTYFVGAGIKPFDGLEIKGAYYIQDNELNDYGATKDSSTGIYSADNYGTYDLPDDPQAFKVILDVSQDLLKFTSLWVEYDHIEEGFYGPSTVHAIDNYVSAFKYKYYMVNNTAFAADHDIIYAYAVQQWTPKIGTYVEYEYADADGAEDMTYVGIAARYTYSSALTFEFLYGIQDGTCTPNKDYDNNFIRFRTFFNF